MATRAPTLGQVAVSVAFAFSCFGLLLFLWSAFGGPVPFAPEGYRVKVPFTEGVQLAEQSDVRIANVSVGKVTEIELEDSGENRDHAIAEIEIDEAYAPIPEDTRAILRQKTLLGETYVELTPGSEGAPTLAEDATLPAAQVSDAVQLDEIFRAFDDRTRSAFQTWMQQAALALSGRGSDLSAALANLEPFAEDANRLVRVLDSQQQAVSQFVNNTGVVFEALSERRGQLRGLIRNSGAVFSITARRDLDLREALIALPTFLDESRLTLDRLDRFAADTDPLITQLRPAARELSGVLRQTGRVAPDFRSFFSGFRKLAKRSRAGLPALRRLLGADLPPVLTALDPFLREFTPVVETVNRYRREVTAFLGNVAAASNAVASAPETGGSVTHYLRGAVTVHPESTAVFPGTSAAPPNGRLRTNRSNPYLAPGGAINVPPLGFETRYCGGPPGTVANLDPATAADPGFAARATLLEPDQLFENLREFIFRGETSTAAVPAPACSKQPPQPSIGGVADASDYTHVFGDSP